MDESSRNIFLSNLLETLNRFHEWQLENADNDGRTPYKYDTLGLAEWLEFDRGVRIVKDQADQGGNNV